jgi:hypothetical protein
VAELTDEAWSAVSLARLVAWQLTQMPPLVPAMKSVLVATAPEVAVMLVRRFAALAELK